MYTMYISVRCRHGRYRMVVGFGTTAVPMQSVSITTNIARHIFDTLYNKICQRFSSCTCTLVSSTLCQDIPEILLKVVLKTITLTPYIGVKAYNTYFNSKTLTSNRSVFN
jgi:hypothetical protein